MALTQRLTLAEFLALPEEDPALELEPGGFFVQKPSAEGRHSRLQLVLCERINQFAEPRHLALALPELRVIFGGAAYVPAVSVYEWDRIPRTPDGEIADVFDQPPDAAIEIVSPPQSPNAVVPRCVWYIENGVALALLVDPADRSIVRFQQDHAARVVCAGDDIDFGAVLHGFRLTVDEVFGALRLP